MAASAHAGPEPLPEALAWGPEQLEPLRARVYGGEARYDLVVIGAGITGAGVARDAALRGLKVLVLEASDVAYGTSSRSSRLIHGGVRYLEQGEFGLVFEALRERDRLLRAAPHLVRPASFLFPSREGDRLAPWKLRVGLSMYDALRLGRGARHRGLSAEEACELEPLLRAGEAGGQVERLRGAVVYEDAITDDARLTLAVLRDALRAGAEVLTRAPVMGVRAATAPAPSDRWPDEGPGAFEEARGQDASAEGWAQVRLDAGRGVVHARAVVVAAGPWSGPSLLGRAGDDLLSLSKGVHVVVEREACPVRAPVVVQVRGARRILFAVPWGARTYLGTTDSAYRGDPGQSQVSAAEERQVFELVSRALPGARLGPEAIISAWSGVRPLVRPPGRAAGADTVELARTHRIVHAGPGLYGLVGGKLTTFRQMAEDMVDVVVDGIEREGARRFSRCVTAGRELVPGTRAAEPERAGAGGGGREDLLAALWPRHGAEAWSLCAQVERSGRAEELAAPLVAGLPYRRVELAHAVRCEGARSVSDLLRRRLPLVLSDRALGGGVAREAAEAIADAWGHDGAWIERALAVFAEEVEAETRRRPKL